MQKFDQRILNESVSGHFHNGGNGEKQTPGTKIILWQVTDQKIKTSETEQQYTNTGTDGINARSDPLQILKDFHQPCDRRNPGVLKQVL